MAAVMTAGWQAAARTAPPPTRVAMSRATARSRARQAIRAAECRLLDSTPAAQRLLVSTPAAQLLLDSTPAAQRLLVSTPAAQLLLVSTPHRARPIPT